MGRFIKTKQRVKRGSVLPPNRHHKGVTFRPVAYFKTKREVNKFLRERRQDNVVIAHNRYYRVYKRKYAEHDRYYVYVSDIKRKHSYGGVRRRSRLGEGRHSKPEYKGKPKEFRKQILRSRLNK